MINENSSAKEEKQIKISLVEAILIFMSCISIALGAIYFIVK